MVTQHIGPLIPASATHKEPYNLARNFATLDLLSEGHGDRNIRTSRSDAEANSFGREVQLDCAIDCEHAAELIFVVKDLWGSCAYGTFVDDKASGEFFDKSKMCARDHRGTAALNELFARHFPNSRRELLRRSPL